MAVVLSQASKTCGLGARLGLQTSQAELQASLSPADYVYGQPTQQQLQRLVKQQMGAMLPSGAQPAAATQTAAGFGGPAALQGAAPLAAAAAGAGAAAKPAGALAASVDDLFNNHLALELDDDCLRILLGEDEDESAPCVSAAAAGGSGKGTAGSAGGGSEKSSVTGAEGASAAAGGGPSAAACGDAEAASHLPPHFEPEDDDDIAMLFSEFRGHAGGAASLEPLDLHLLGTAHLAASDDTSDTASQAGDDADADHGNADDQAVLDAAADAAAGLKRVKARSGAAAGSGCASGAASPSGRGLMLSMNYEKAAESINLELLAAGRKAAAPCPDGLDMGMLPLLSPLMEFPHLDTPDSPDSLTSGSHAMAALPAGIKHQDSGSKRKRAVRQ